MKICPRCSATFPDDSAFCVHDASPLSKLLDPLLGRTIAQSYRLISRIAVGSVSSVYLARHVMIDRLSAVKILRSDFAANVAARDRFLREARAVNRINHENIAEITDYGETAGIVFLVMEYVAGDSIRKHLKAGPLPVRRVLAAAIQLASALGRAHQMGVIHRNLKPENLLLVRRKDGSESLKVIDFGSAKIIDAPSHTPSDHVFGTIGYVAPEYFEAGKIDARGDLFSMGVVLYEALTGQLPFAPGTSIPPSRQGLTGLGPLEHVPDMPAQLAHAIARLLSRRVEDRQHDAFIVQEQLTSALAQAPAPSSAARAPLTPRRDRVAFGASPLSSEELAPPTSRDPEPTDPNFSPPPASQDIPRPPRMPDVGKALVPSSPAIVEPPLLPVSPTRRSLMPMAPPVPDMSAIPFEDLEPLCKRAFARAQDAMALFQAVAPQTRYAFNEAERLLAALAASADAARVDQARIVHLEGRGRDFKENLGRALDELGRDASRAAQMAEQIQERARDLDAQRSAAVSAPAADALLWEQAALDEEGRRARTAAEDVAFQMNTLRDVLQRQSDTLENELGDARASLEGHVAALRTLALEIWSNVDDCAKALGISRMPLAPIASQPAPPERGDGRG